MSTEQNAERPPAPADDAERRRAIIAPHFDEANYRGQLGEASSSIADPVGHYVESGWSEGLDPHPAFSTDFYAAAYADALGAEGEPYSAHLLSAEATARPATHAALNRAALALGDAFDVVAAEVDRSFYVDRFPGLRGTSVNVAQHWLTYGASRGVAPNAWFDMAHYLSRSPDVLASGMNPFVHYLRWGRLEGRTPGPDDADPRRPSPPPEAEEVGRAFDAAFYLKSHPELAANHVDPLRHYLAFGWRMGWDPSPTFSVEHYRSRSPDVAAAGIEPFFHFLTFGRREGRTASPDGDGSGAPPLSDDDLLVARAFDAAFYLEAYPDIAANHVDPLRHFLRFGWQAGLDPNAAFSTAFYAARSPEPLSGNPFVHYLTVGRSRGRLPRSPDPEGGTDLLTSAYVRETVASAFDPAFYRERYADLDPATDPLDHWLRLGWTEGRDPSPSFSTSAHLKAWPDVAATRVNPLLHAIVRGSPGVGPASHLDGEPHG